MHKIFKNGHRLQIKPNFLITSEAKLILHGIWESSTMHEILKNNLSEFRYKTNFLTFNV